MYKSGRGPRRRETVTRQEPTARKYGHHPHAEKPCREEPATAPPRPQSPAFLANHPPAWQRGHPRRGGGRETPVRWPPALPQTAASSSAAPAAMGGRRWRPLPRHPRHLHYRQCHPRCRRRCLCHGGRATGGVALPPQKPMPAAASVAVVVVTGTGTDVAAAGTVGWGPVWARVPTPGRPRVCPSTAPSCRPPTLWARATMVLCLARWGWQEQPRRWQLRTPLGRRPSRPPRRALQMRRGWHRWLTGCCSRCCCRRGGRSRSPTGGWPPPPRQR